MYSCIVVIDNPTNGYYATTVSAPVFRKLPIRFTLWHTCNMVSEYEADKTYRYKNGLKEDFRTIFDELDMDIDGVRDADGADWVVTASNEGENIVIKPRRISYSSVPNVKGMGLRDALYVLENSGLKVDFSGAGMVQRQSLQPGAEVPKGSYIRIELR
ncbi:MAG: PASTA domain-containing protein [Odoribacter splanchnicus]